MKEAHVEFWRDLTQIFYLVGDAFKSTTYNIIVLYQLLNETNEELKRALVTIFQ